MYSMASLLLHEVAVPGPVRLAVKAAIDGPISERTARLRSAAQLLYRETDLPCDDVKELLDLSASEERCECVVDDYAMLEAHA